MNATKNGLDRNSEVSIIPMNTLRPITAIVNDLNQLLAQSLLETDAAFSLAEEIEGHPDGLQAVGLLLLLLEKNQSLDWGAPGPLVHAAETFFNRGYESLLLESIARTPTSHTLWMANRVINGVQEEMQKQFLSAMNQVVSRDDISDEIRNTARSFLDFQNTEG